MAPASLGSSTLQGALTPRGLFTNLFPLTFASSSVGTIRQTEKAKKEEFSDRLRPRFYQSGSLCYAYGAGLDDLKDDRFTPAIIAPATDPDFALHLAKYGLVGWLRERGFVVRTGLVGVSVLDHEDPILDTDDYVKILPEYKFQTNLVEGAQGERIFAFSIDVGWTTAPVFELGTRVAKYARLLGGLKLVLACKECHASCPLFDRIDRVVGKFDSFADDGTALTSACKHLDYKPQVVHVAQRLPVGPRKRGKRPATTERMIELPGQVLKPAASQRRVLKLFKEANKLAIAGRVWLGDLTKDHKLRADGLKVRYGRIQNFLARLADHETAGLTFSLESGTKATLERVPVTAEMLING